jgi:flagellar basal-body rod protein FlgB
MFTLANVGPAARCRISKWGCLQPLIALMPGTGLGRIGRMPSTGPIATALGGAVRAFTEEHRMISRLTDGLDFHSQALVLRAERQRLIAGNIANADTPGYQARDFDFASALRNASGGSLAGEGIAQGVMSPGGRPQPVLRYALASQTSLDNNSVDMDRERASFVDNSVKYESTLRFINGSVKTTLDAMKSYHQG